MGLAGRRGSCIKGEISFERDTSMNATDISALAHHLFQTQGAKAIAEAAQRAESFREKGDEEQARTWERVEEVLREMRGARQS
jgi:hypothetical protein